ncbi:hypothetical protein GBAR_LOCUS24223 [Geodia barretti]|uniref:Uncharacterized protein n=1 Tax=Geodia barretti TaxID=519541 RepID=A0AA35TA63_GEOBA|nr:hypothetical protein GBAR_LOCUS24223 [Geodia barretti]
MGLEMKTSFFTLSSQYTTVRLISTPLDWASPPKMMKHNTYYQ